MKKAPAVSTLLLILLLTFSIARQAHAETAAPLLLKNSDPTGKMIDQSFDARINDIIKLELSKSLTEQQNTELKRLITVQNTLAEAFKLRSQCLNPEEVTLALKDLGHFITMLKGTCDHLSAEIPALLKKLTNQVVKNNFDQLPKDETKALAQIVSGLHSKDQKQLLTENEALKIGADLSHFWSSTESEKLIEYTPLNNFQENEESQYAYVILWSNFLVRKIAFAQNDSTKSVHDKIEANSLEDIIVLLNLYFYSAHQEKYETILKLTKSFWVNLLEVHLSLQQDLPLKNANLLDLEHEFLKNGLPSETSVERAQKILLTYKESAETSEIIKKLLEEMRLYRRN